MIIIDSGTVPWTFNIYHLTTNEERSRDTQKYTGKCFIFGFPIMYFMSQHHSAHVISREFRGAAKIFSRAGGGQASLGKMGCVSGKSGKREKGKFWGIWGYTPTC